MTKQQVYYMPGMAASPSIFEYIKLDPKRFKTNNLEWIQPLSINESIEAYAKRISIGIEPNSILIGVSFGGILVQEISKIIPCKQLIIISSIKSNQELPKIMRFAQTSGIHKLLPVELVGLVKDWRKLAFSPKTMRKATLYEKYLSVRDPKYLRWCISQVINWSQQEPLENTLHLHGEFDHVFPIQYIKNAIVVPKGTHAMIITKANWMNQYLNKHIFY